MNKLSIVGSDYLKEENVVGYYNTDDRMNSGGKWDLSGRHLGNDHRHRIFMIPGFGPLFVAGR